MQLALYTAGPHVRTSLSSEIDLGVAETPTEIFGRYPWDNRFGASKSFIEVTGNDGPGNSVCINVRIPTPWVP